jgi:hypothetical protein
LTLSNSSPFILERKNLPDCICDLAVTIVLWAKNIKESINEFIFVTKRLSLNGEFQVKATFIFSLKFQYSWIITIITTVLLIDVSRDEISPENYEK